MECMCSKCKTACVSCPGWFLPGEAEKAAEFMGLSLQDFFKKYLGVNWWEGNDPIFVLAPMLVGENAGEEYPGDPRGICIFYNDKGLCDIHLVKPYECASLVCNDPDTLVRHEKVADAWKDKQEFIEELLGYKPKTVAFSIF